VKVTFDDIVVFDLFLTGGSLHVGHYSAIVTATQISPAIAIQVYGRDDPNWIQFNNLVICPLAGAQGDPQFTGFSGQMYQVHGTSDTVYNIISSSSLQFNALFTYRESGKCRQGTSCFSHPGNYFGSVGILIKEAEGVERSLTIHSGPVDTGLTVHVVDPVNDNSTQLLPVGHEFKLGEYTIRVVSDFEVVFESDEFNIRVQNSDNFLNQDVSIGSGLLSSISQYRSASKNGDLELAEKLKHVLPHGILGQTWSTETYTNRWKHIQGQLFDYIMNDGLRGKLFKYNRF